MSTCLWGACAAKDHSVWLGKDMRENGMEGERSHSTEVVCFSPMSLSVCAKVSYSSWLWQWPVLAWQQRGGLHYPKVIFCCGAEQLLGQNHPELGCDKWWVQGSSGSLPGLHPSHSESSADGQAEPSQPLLATQSMLTCPAVKEKLEKAFLGICLDGLLFLKGCIAGAEGAGGEEENCAIFALLNKKSTTFGEFCVSCRAEIIELLPLEAPLPRLLSDQAGVHCKWSFTEGKKLPWSDLNLLPVFRTAKCPWGKLQIWKTGLSPNNLHLPLG